MHLSKRSQNPGEAHLGLMTSRAETSTHKLQWLGGWRSSVMVERHAHLAPDQSREGRRLDSLLGGYDWLRRKRKGVNPWINPLIYWYAVQGSNLRPTD
jgi:hypothetical protein